jgi:hypothetical protein
LSTKQHPSSGNAGRHHTDASRREQALCVQALSSGDYDNMSDGEWVALCEQVAREEAEAAASACAGEEGE